MRALQIDRFGDLDVLALVNVPEPQPADGEVLVRVIASAINPVDDKTREGAIGEGTPPLPMTLGWELAGIVVNPGTSGLSVGERVFGMSHQLATGRGSWADLVVIPAASIAQAPTSVSLVEAATLPLPGLTALQTMDWLRVGQGDKLLVAGAAGAVGGLAVQLACARGAQVDALVSRQAHIKVVQELGADHTPTDRTTLPVGGYDAVFDTFGAFVTDAVADGGRYASIATQAGPVPDLSHRRVRTTVNQVREDGRRAIRHAERESRARAFPAGEHEGQGRADLLNGPSGKRSTSRREAISSTCVWPFLVPGGRALTMERGHPRARSIITLSRGRAGRRRR